MQHERSEPMRRWILLVYLALAASGAVAVAMPAAASAAEGVYCDEVVPAHTDCATSPGHSWDWWNGRIYFNAAQYLGEGTVSVCEHTYRRSNGETVSEDATTGSPHLKVNLKSITTSTSNCPGIRATTPNIPTRSSAPSFTERTINNAKDQEFRV